MTGARVVVVGGGLAGLTAALDLADAGLAVTLLESRPRLGGATWSFEHHGLWFDNGQHVFLRCCRAYQQFLTRIGASSDVKLQDRLSLPVVAPGGRTAWLRRNDLPAPLHLAGSLLRYAHLPLRDRLGLGRAALGLRRLHLGDAALDRSTFGRFLAERGQRPAAVDALWDLICIPTVNLPAAEASLTLAATVFQIGLLTDRAAGDIGWSRVPLARLHADPARRALEQAGVEIRTHARVRGLDPANGELTVRLDGAALPAAAVVLAVPHEPAAELVPSEVQGAQRWPELGTSPIVNVHLVYDRKVMPHEVVAGVGTPVQFVFDRTDTAALSEGQCLGISLSAADQWLAAPSRELVAMVERELVRLFPAAGGATRLEALVTREPAATFRGAPGTASLRPGPRTAVPGLYLAGAWTDTGWPATMEGAVRSGSAAARAVIADRSRLTTPTEVLA